MTCAEFEVLLCDYLDGTLSESQRIALESHREVCAVCTELSRDVTAVVAFVDRAADVEPPAELLTRITFEIPGGASRGWRSWIAGWLQPILQPRFAMGMAMTILSFGMLGRLTGIEPRQLKPADLNPAAVWNAFDNKVNRTWERAVKYYENLRLVYEVQTRLQEWTRQEDEERKGRPMEERPPAADQTTEGQKR